MPLSIALASAELTERLIATLMPVVLVKAASMSSSAFFIDTAAYTVTVLSCACAGRAAVRAKSSARAVHLSMAILVQTSKCFLACLGRLCAMCFGRFWHKAGVLRRRLKRRFLAPTDLRPELEDV